MFIADSVHIATSVQRKNKSMGETTHSTGAVDLKVRIYLSPHSYLLEFFHL